GEAEASENLIRVLTVVRRAGFDDRRSLAQRYTAPNKRHGAKLLVRHLLDESQVLDLWIGKDFIQCVDGRTRNVVLLERCQPRVAVFRLEDRGEKIVQHRIILLPVAL